jgi:hypothetical protein
LIDLLFSQEKLFPQNLVNILTKSKRHSQEGLIRFTVFTRKTIPSKFSQYFNQVKEAFSRGLDRFTVFTRKLFPPYFSAKKMSSSFDDFLNYLRTLPSRIKNGFNAIRQLLTKENLIAGLGRMIARSVIAIKGLGRGLDAALDMKRIASLFRNMGAGIRVGLKGLGGMLTGGWLNIIFAAIDGAMGAYEGWNRAGTIFDSTIKKNIDGVNELTVAMKISAAVGGGLAGILDGLLFGILTITGMKQPLADFFSMFAYGIALFGDAIKKGFGTWWQSLAGSFMALGEALGGLWKTFAGTIRV